MSPNVYVHIAMIQPHSSTENDLPMRLYGVESIKVVNSETILQPVVEMPKEIEPESDFKINVSEIKGKSMTYTIAVVDEGLLDLTGFKTPKPWNYFYAKEALGVKTWDMYKYVISANKGEMAWWWKRIWFMKFGLPPIFIGQSTIIIYLIPIIANIVPVSPYMKAVMANLVGSTPMIESIPCRGIGEYTSETLTSLATRCFAPSISLSSSSYIANITLSAIINF